MVALTNYADGGNSREGEDRRDRFRRRTPSRSPLLSRRRIGGRLSFLWSHPLKSATVIFAMVWQVQIHPRRVLPWRGIRQGGHLGYRVEEIFSEEEFAEKMLPEIRKFVDRVKPGYREEYTTVIAAGGIIFDRDDVERVFKLGASAVSSGNGLCCHGRVRCRLQVQAGICRCAQRRCHDNQESCGMLEEQSGTSS